MSTKLENEFRAQLGPEFKKDTKPVVYFFDHAVEDPELTKESGRPRFVNRVYISKRSPMSDPRLEDFHRPSYAEDRAEFPQEWARYEQIHANLQRPRVKFLPGIDLATVAEMHALDIYTLTELTAQDLFPEWKDKAQRILSALEAPAPKPAPKAEAVGDLNGNFSIAMTM